MAQRARIEHRTLGLNGLSVSTVGLGCMSLSGTYGKSDDQASIALLHYALDQGVDFLDTSDVYGWGHNEELLAQVLKTRRNEIRLATKFGQVKGGDGVDGSPKYVAEACEASLKRLGVEVIDLYYQHRVDPKVPIEDTVGAMARLVEAGKVKHLGLCEAKPSTISRANAVYPLAAVQTEYSLLYRSAAEETLATTRELGIGFVAYAPLGRGFLAGAIRDLADVQGDRRAKHPRFAGANFASNRQLVARVEAIAAEKGCSPAALTIAWLLAQGPDIVPIPGTKREGRLDDNLSALQVKLSPADVARIAAAVPRNAVAGARYPEGGMKRVHL